MRRIGVLLAALFLLHFSVPAWADLANCDGPTTPEEAERRAMLDGADPVGTNPIYSAADTLLDACEAAKKKLNSALESLSGPSSSSVGTPAEDAAVPRATPASPAPRAPMSRNIAVIERDRVAGMDEKAASLVQSNCGGFGCSRLLESMVDPVIREAEALNANPEYLAHMPRYSPIASVEAAARFGWSRQDGYWVQAPPQARPGSANTGTLGAYLLSADECRKLRDTLDREIKASAAREPDNLSFFEGECVPQQASYADDVRNWRALLALEVKRPRPVSASGGGTLLAANGAGLGDAREAAIVVVPDAGLREWNEGIVAEEQRYQAEMLATAEAKQRADEEKKRAEADAARQRQATMAEAERDAARKGWVLPSDCQAEQAAVRQFQDDDRTGNDTEQSIAAALKRPWVYRWGGKNGEMTVTELQESEQEYLRSIESDEKRVARCRTVTGLDRIGCPTEETSSIRLNRLTACAYRTAAARRSGSVLSGASAVSTTQSSADASCEAKIKAIDDQVGGAVSRCGESATCNFQAAMWGLSQQIGAIERYCPSGKFAAKLSEAKAQLEGITANCNQIQSGGGRCSPRL